MSLENLKPLLAEYAHIKAERDRLDKRLKELDKQVRPSLVDEGEVVVAGVSFTCLSMSGRKSFDKKLFAQVHPEIDLASFDKIGAPYTQLKVKEVKEL